VETIWTACYITIDNHDLYLKTKCYSSGPGDGTFDISIEGGEFSCGWIMLETEK